MNSSTFCVFQCKDVPDKILTFTEEKLRQCYEKLCVRKALQMKYGDIDLPEQVSETHGYHSICCKNFLAIPKKYLQKFDEMKKSDENKTSSASFASISGKLNSSRIIPNSLHIVSIVFH